MKYDFDQLIDRDTTHSTKWLKFSDPDVLPMWIADMDFLCPPEVTNPMIERVNQGIFGYTDTPVSLTESFIEHVNCLLYTSPSPRDKRQSRMPSSA